MRIAVVSDTHGNTVYMDRVLGFIQDIHKVKLLLHLGDSYADGTYMLRESGLVGAVVPGIYCDEYHDSGFPNVIRQECGEWCLLMVHALKDYPGSGAEVNMVLYGHTHVAACENKAGIYYINPGHLKEEVSKGQAPSYGILDTGEETIFEWYHPYKQPVLCRREILL